MRKLYILGVILCGCSTVDVPAIHLDGGDWHTSEEASSFAEKDASLEAGVVVSDTSQAVKEAGVVDTSAEVNEAGIVVESTTDSESEAGLSSVQTSSSSEDSGNPMPHPVCGPEVEDDPLNTDWWPNKEQDQASNSFVPEGSVILDLRVDHVTPYGGWFTFGSLVTDWYDSDLILCWSTEAQGLDTTAQMYAAYADGSCVVDRTFARQGVDVFPIVVTSLTPDTTYYVRAGYETWGGVDNPSNVLQIKTKLDPLAGLQWGEHPRTLVTKSQLDRLKERYDAEEERVRYWADLSAIRTRRAINPEGDLSGPGSYATNAAMLGHITGDAYYLEGGRYLIEQYLLPEYLEKPTGNQYRWAQPHLATAVDLFWDSLSVELRQRILDTIVEVDELTPNTNPRITDTDEYASMAQIQIAHGLAFLGATDLDPVSLERLRVVFERAVRWWYGVLQVKARRGDAVWGLSGGALDDGIAYANGTHVYWLETFWMLENAGLSQAEYAPWIWNHARSQTIHTMLPGYSGLITYGDIEQYNEDGTYFINKESWGAEALQICMLRQYCLEAEAGFVQDALRVSRDPSERGPHHWALLCDDSSIPSKELKDLPTAFRSNGFGLVFDRTGWEADDSFLFFSAGWRAVDHVHDDAGHFSLWSNGSFVTHELPSYDLHNADKHNVLLLSDSSNQDHQESPGLSRILKTVSDDTSLYVLADLTSAYNQDYDDLLIRVVHDQVTRTLVWNKLTDEVLVYDRVIGGLNPEETGVQNFLGTPLVTELYQGRIDNRLELLSVVNGTGTLEETEDTFTVEQFGILDRHSGELLQQ